MKYDHTELKDGEIWVFNTGAKKGIKPHFACLKTIRFGNQAYDIDGNKLSPDYILPVYVHKSEYDELNKIWQNEIDKSTRAVKY